MNRFKKEKEKRSFNNLRYLIRVLYLFVFVLIALQIIVSNSLISSGDNINRMSIEIDNLKSENRNLDEEIAKTNSLSILTNLAKGNGFVKSNSTVVLSENLPVAQGRMN